MGRSTRQMNKLVYHDNVEVLTNAKAKIIRLYKIDADSIPAAYIKSCKISLVDNSAPSDNVNYSFYAALDDGLTLNSDRIIDHWTSGPGGGTGWMNFNRKIWNNQDGQVGGPITIWAECSATADTTSITITTFCERARQEKV